MHFLQILLLAVIQGFAELLPVSSSAHVILAEKLMGLDPTSPEMTLMLVMLHTGTMLAVLLYFGKGWKQRYLRDRATGVAFAKQALLATFATGVVGLGLKWFIEKWILVEAEHAEVEMLFGDLRLVSLALASAGALILYAGLRKDKPDEDKLSSPISLAIGLVQGLCLPFRGFSRSGATISTALILGLTREKAEDFSFALAVILTPPVLAREIHRLMGGLSLEQGLPLLLPGLLGMGLSFAAGLLALRWLTGWLEKGRWAWFGAYCLAFALLVFLASHSL